MPAQGSLHPTLDWRNDGRTLENCPGEAPHLPSRLSGWALAAKELVHRTGTDWSQQQQWRRLQQHQAVPNCSQPRLQQRSKLENLCQQGTNPVPISRIQILYCSFPLSRRNEVYDGDAAKASLPTLSVHSNSTISHIPNPRDGPHPLPPSTLETQAQTSLRVSTGRTCISSYCDRKPRKLFSGFPCMLWLLDLPTSSSRQFALPCQCDCDCDYPQHHPSASEEEEGSGHTTHPTTPNVPSSFCSPGRRVASTCQVVIDTLGIPLVTRPSIAIA